MQLQLANDSRLNVGTRITYRCYANIGVDSNVLITWERTSLMGTSTLFATYTPTVSTDIVQDPVTNSSCSYTRTSSMYYNMTNLDDDGVTFRCKVRAFIGNQWYEPISVHRRAFTIEGVSMTVTPSSMVIGSANPVNSLELRCVSDGTNNNGIFSLAISRRRSTDIDYVGIVTIDVFGITQDKIPTDIQAKSPNVTGSLVGTPPTSGILMLTMNGGDITCNDQAEFKCEMSFRITTDTNTHSDSASSNLAVITAPNDVRITDSVYEDKGMQLQLANDSRLNVGTRITYRCYANIGVDPNVLITWERTSLLGTSTVFATYTPTVSTDIVQDPVINSSCSYTRTSTMYYNMTNLDDDGVTFRCKVRAYIGNQWYEPISFHRRTFTISSGGNTGGNTSGLSGTSSEAGVIAGAVIGAIAGVVLLIVLVYFLWYRRRSTGESYRTKEEGERPEPPPTDYTYATTDKKKRTNLGTKVGDSDGRKPPGSSELHYAELELSKEPRPTPRKSKASDPPVEYTEIHFSN